MKKKVNNFHRQPGKQAKVLDNSQILTLFKYIKETSKHPERDRALFLLSFEAGLRAQEIAKLEREVCLDAEGNTANEIFIGSRISKSKGSRYIPASPRLQGSLSSLFKRVPDEKYVAYTPYRGDHMTEAAVRQVFYRIYKGIGFIGCSSHSGRRTFITRAARKANLHNCSLKDVQTMAGHQHLKTTQSYIELSETAGKLVSDLYS